jgi:hypothetical protein
LLVIPIVEPVTMLTDYALGVAALYFAVRLVLAKGPSNRTSIRLWVLGFAVTGLAAFVGGTFHGFARVLDPPALRSLWNITMISIGAGSAFMAAGAIAASIKKTDESRVWLWRGVIVTMVGFLIQLTGFRQGLDFNHNDAFHVTQVVGLYLFYRGAALLQDRKS